MNPDQIELLRDKLKHIVDNAIAYGPLQRDERLRIIYRIDAQFHTVLRDLTDDLPTL